MTEQVQTKQSGVWGARIVIILLFTIIGAGVGFSTKFWQMQHPPVTAQIDMPKAAGLGNYNALFNTYMTVNGSNTENRDLTAEVQSTVFAEFNRTLQTDLLPTFLAQQESVKEWAKFQNQTAEQIANEMARGFTAQITANGTLIGLPSYFANTEITSKLLTDFLTVAAAKSKEELYADLVYKWKNLFQQVKNTADTAQNPQEQQAWANKLKLMQSVQPLDNQLQVFSYIKMPSAAQAETIPWQWVIIGAAVAFVLGLLLSLGLVKRK